MGNHKRMDATFKKIFLNAFMIFQRLLF